MSWQHNATTTAASKKASMLVEYSNLIKEFEEYMPQIKASLKDLQEPSQSFVTKFYTDVLSEFFCDVNNLTEIQVNQNLTYNEMYGETVPILNMCMAFRHIYIKLGVEDFGLNDICDPSPKRTYCLLQTMINFIKYSDQKISELDEKMKTVRNMKEKMDKLKKQKDILVNTINKKTLDHKQREAEMKTVADDVKVGKSELMSIKKHEDEILKELDRVKLEQEETDKTWFKLCNQKDKITKDIITLRAQIVESPDLIKADYEQLKRLKNEVTEKKSAMMAQISSKKQTSLILEQELVAQEKRSRLLTDATEKNEKLLKLVNEIEIKLQEKSELIESSGNLKEKIEFMERERADIKNKINCFVKEMEMDRNSYNSQHDALQKEIDKMMTQKSIQCDTIKSIENDINKCNLRKKELEDEVATILDDFELQKNTINLLQNNYHAEVIKRHQDEYNNLDKI